MAIRDLAGRKHSAWREERSSRYSKYGTQEYDTADAQSGQSIVWRCLRLENGGRYLKPGQRCGVGPVSSGHAAGASSPLQDLEEVLGLGLPGGSKSPLLLFAGSEPLVLLKTLPKEGGEKQSGKANIL